MSMDKSAIIAALVTSHGIKLSEDDPAFVLVELNKIILKDNLEDLNKLLSEISSRSDGIGVNVETVGSLMKTTLESLEASAMAMAQYAKREREANEASLKAATDNFMKALKKSNAEYKAYLWAILAAWLATFLVLIFKI